MIIPITKVRITFLSAFLFKFTDVDFKKEYKQSEKKNKNPNVIGVYYFFNIQKIMGKSYLTILIKII